MESVVLIGGGGHASTVLSVFEAINEHYPLWKPVGLLDDRSDGDMGRFRGRGVDRLGPVAALGGMDEDTKYVVAAGWPKTRRALVERISGLPHRAAVARHPDSTTSTGVVIGAGSVVCAGVRLGPLATIGEHVYLAQQASVSHDSIIGAFTSLMPGASVSGDATIGEAVMLGAGAIVLEGRTIGDEAVVGAGAVVTEDVPAGATVVGVPARQRSMPAV